MERHDQIDLFAATYEKPEGLPKHIRLIEFFAGIGAQAKALEILNADFEHWRTCEWSWQSITAYNAIHIKTTEDYSKPFSYDEILNAIRGVSHDYNKPMTEKQLRARGEEWARKVYNAMIGNNNFCPDISRLHAKDLDIEDREHNTYVLTYSFPCQDLSAAGLGKGMEKGSGTRSGLLWEVERILLECKAADCLPQVLIMENVPQVIGTNNVNDFNLWLKALEDMGYTNYHKVLNAADYAIPQNRNRCFMVSILGEFSFHFPKKQELRYRLRDFKEKNVDEYYYLSDELVASFQAHTEKQIEKGNGFRFSPTDGSGKAHTLTTREGQRTDDNFLFEEPSTKGAHYSQSPSNNGLSSSTEEGEGNSLSPEKARQGEEVSAPLELHIPSATKKGYMEAEDGDGILPHRIRKLTEGECMRFMGFERKDTEACREVGLSRANIYHSAGDSIVTTVLAGIFGELFGLDYEKAINDYADKLHGEVI